MFTSSSVMQYPLLIFRRRFTTNPPQLLIILFEDQDTINFMIYNSASGVMKEDKMEMKEVQMRAPYLMPMLKLRKFYELGIRLYSSFKNNLIVKESANEEEFLNKKMKITGGVLPGGRIVKKNHGFLFK